MIIQEGHIEKLEYGWWEPKRGNVMLPKTLGDKKNFVLTHEELAHYDLFLTKFAAEINKERERVSLTMKALYKGKVTSWEGSPTYFTLAHVLELLVKHAKAKLELMHILNYIAKRRVDEQGSTPKTDQSPRGADS